MRLIAALLVFIFLPSVCGAKEFGPGSKVAFLGLTFLDTSTEGAYNGERADETARLAMLEQMVAERFLNEKIELLNLAPISEKLENTVNPANCYGCEVRMAKELNADFVVVGLVQKVSNLILSMNLVMRDVESGEFVLGRSVDIRSNTDNSWARGMNYILKTTFFRKAN